MPEEPDASDEHTEPLSPHFIEPTSAADLLQNASNKTVESSKLDSDIKEIDHLLGGGVEKGKVTEVWGPPGSGKGSLALAIASRSMEHGKQVTWLACRQPLSSTRSTALQSSELLHIIRPPYLSHLIAITRFPERFFSKAPRDIVIIDDFSSLVELEYPRQATYTTSADSETRRWQAGRRSAILASIVFDLNHLATAHNVAVLVLNGCATTNRTRSGSGPTLVSAISGLDWDMGVWCRLALFRDFNGRFAALQRSRGSNVPSSSFLESLAHFALDGNGVAIDAPTEATTPGSGSQMMTKVTKRKIDEVAASDGELDEYGWDDPVQLSDPEVQIIG